MAALWPEARSGLGAPRPAVGNKAPQHPELRPLLSSAAPLIPRNLGPQSCALWAPKKGVRGPKPVPGSPEKGRRCVCGEAGAGAEGDTGLVTSEPGACGGAEASGRREEQQAGGRGARGGATPGPPCGLRAKFPSFARLDVSLGAAPSLITPDSRLPGTKEAPARPPPTPISKHLPTRRQRPRRPRGAARARAGGRAPW